MSSGLFFSWLTFRKPQCFQQKTSWPIWVPGSHKTPRTSSRWGEAQRNPSCKLVGFSERFPPGKHQILGRGFPGGVVILKVSTYQRCDRKLRITNRHEWFTEDYHDIKNGCLKKTKLFVIMPSQK